MRQRVCLPEDVATKEQGQAGDDANHGRRDGRQGRAQAQIAARRFHEGRAGQDEDERGQESKPAGDERAAHARQPQLLSRHGMAPAADKTDEGDDHDQRAGRRFAQRQAIHHLRARDPVVVVGGALHQVGQHGIRAAKREQGRLAEKHAHLRQRLVRAARQRQAQPDEAGQRQAHGSRAKQARPAEARVVRRRRVVIDQGGAVAGRAAVRRAVGMKVARQPAPARHAQQGGAEHDQWKWQL
ncbi:hypothetical protein D3C72_1013070 [compost metagenome]